MIFGEGHQGLDRLLGVRITHELMRLINEDDTAAPSYEVGPHLLGGLVCVLGDEHCRKDFDDFVFGKNPQCMEELGDDAGHGGLTGACGTFENHVHSGFRELASLAQFYAASPGDVRKAVEMALDVL